MDQYGHFHSDRTQKGPQWKLTQRAPNWHLAQCGIDTGTILKRTFLRPLNGFWDQVAKMQLFLTAKSLSKTAPRWPILDFYTIFGNVRPSPSLLEHPQPFSRPNERAIRGGGNGFYLRMISRFFGQKLSEVDYNRLQTGRGWQGMIRGLKTVATMCLHAQQFIQFGRAALTQFFLKRSGSWSRSQEKLGLKSIGHSMQC